MCQVVEALPYEIVPWQAVTMLLADPHPRVRFAALHCVGEHFSTRALAVATAVRCRPELEGSRTAVPRGAPRGCPPEICRRNQGRRAPAVSSKPSFCLVQCRSSCPVQLAESRVYRTGLIFAGVGRGRRASPHVSISHCCSMLTTAWPVRTSSLWRARSWVR